MKDRVEVRPRRLRELALHETEGSMMEEWEGLEILKEEFRVVSKDNGKNDEAYDLWVDLSLLEAYIMFRQVLAISPIARKTLKEGTSVVRRKQKANIY